MWAVVDGRRDAAPQCRRPRDAAFWRNLTLNNCSFTSPIILRRFSLDVLGADALGLMARAKQLITFRRPSLIRGWSRCVFSLVAASERSHPVQELLLKGCSLVIAMTARSRFSRRLRRRHHSRRLLAQNGWKRPLFFACSPHCSDIRHHQSHLMASPCPWASKNGAWRSRSSSRHCASRPISSDAYGPSGVASRLFVAMTLWLAPIFFGALKERWSRRGLRRRDVPRYAPPPWRPLSLCGAILLRPMAVAFLEAPIWSHCDGRGLCGMLLFVMGRNLFISPAGTVEEFLR